MPDSAAPQHSTTSTLPSPSANGSAPVPPAAAAPKRHRRPTRIASIHAWLVAGFGALILLVIFIIQNTGATQINFLGTHARVSQAVALLIAAIAGALLIAAAGTARITQLRRTMRKTATSSERRRRMVLADTISWRSRRHDQVQQEPGGESATDEPGPGPATSPVDTG